MICKDCQASPSKLCEAHRFSSSNHDTAADLEADELRAESQRWRERLGRAEERALQFEKERDEWKAKHAEEWAHVTEYVRLAAEYQVQRDAALKAHKALLADYAGLQAQHFAATQRAEAAEAALQKARDCGEVCGTVGHQCQECLRRMFLREVARAESAEARVRILQDNVYEQSRRVDEAEEARDAAEAALRVARDAARRVREEASDLCQRLPVAFSELDAALAPKEGAP